MRWGFALGAFSLVGCAAREPALRVTETRADALGMTHERSQQFVNGVPVVGAERYVHTDAAGHVRSIASNAIETLDIDVVPKLPAPRDAELVVWAPKESAPRLAYRTRQRDALHIWVITTDANDGTELDRYDDFQTLLATGSGILGTTESFDVSSGGDGFVMVDTTHGAEVRTYTSGATIEVPGALVTSASLDVWDVGVDAAGSAVDAHVNAARVLAYYQTVHGRNAIDGQGGAMISSAHYSEHYENAGWTGTEMVYGDGGATLRSMAFALDIVGHEFTHGVTARTSRLTYSGESGALNEAVSDIFGSFIEHSVRPNDVDNWTFGEGVPLAGGFLRDLADPQRSLEAQPAHLSQMVKTGLDNGGVHANSGIIAHAAYLMTMGGTNPVSHGRVPAGIGWQKSESLWYRANTTYFMSSTTFVQAVDGVMSAAEDIGLDDNERTIVHCAFEATGIVDGPCRGTLDTDAGNHSQTAVAPGNPSRNPATPGGVQGAANSDDTSGDGGGCASAPRRELGWMPLALLGLALVVGRVIARRFSCTSA